MILGLEAGGHLFQYLVFFIFAESLAGLECLYGTRTAKISDGYIFSTYFHRSL